jgi:hypothetical protein
LRLLSWALPAQGSMQHRDGFRIIASCSSEHCVSEQRNSLIQREMMLCFGPTVWLTMLSLLCCARLSPTSHQDWLLLSTPGCKHYERHEALILSAGGCSAQLQKKRSGGTDGEHWRTSSRGTQAEVRLSLCALANVAGKRTRRSRPDVAEHRARNLIGKR